MSSESVSAPTFGAPAFTENAIGIAAVHLHRFLSPTLNDPPHPSLATVRVVLGFEGSEIAPVVLEVTADGATPLDANAPDFDVLCEHARSAGRGESKDGAREDGSWKGWKALPIHCGSGEMVSENLGFLCISPEQSEHLSDAYGRELSHRAGEAIRSFRFNRVRLFFEGIGDARLKTFLYTVLDELPGLCGADHSAALILTGSLEAMALDESASAEFEIVGERLFFDRTDDEGNALERLVGLVVETDPKSGGLLGHAYQAVHSDRVHAPLIYIPNEDNTAWNAFGDNVPVPRFGTRSKRPQEKMTVLVPLIARDAIGKYEMLGFLSINWRKPTMIGNIAGAVLEDIAARLAAYLQRSPLFSLSARQLLLLESVRRDYNDTIGSGGAKHRLHTFIDCVTNTIARATSVPTFAIGYVIQAGGQRSLRFEHAQGFDYFQGITLPIDKIANFEASSIAALAVRLNRPVVLSGGRQDGDNVTFNNDIFVNEEAGLLVDGRRADPATIADGEWRRLSDYYKASREQSYATLAFPISLGIDTLGVIAVEVDRSTDWLWWTGFGSQIFYRLLANELAIAFKLMGVPHA